MDGLTKEQKAEIELKDRAEKAIPVIFAKVDGWMHKWHASMQAAYSLALSYIQLEYNWMPKEYKEKLLSLYI